MSELVVENPGRRHYAAIIGPEARAIILKKLDMQMAGMWAFSAAAAHHNLKFKAVIEIESYPEHATKIEASGEGPQGPAPENIDFRKGTIEIGEEIEYPNKARAEVGLPQVGSVMASDGTVSDFAEGTDPVEKSEKIIADVLKGA